MGNVTHLAARRYDRRMGAAPTFDLFPSLADLGEESRRLLAGAATRLGEDEVAALVAFLEALTSDRLRERAAAGSSIDALATRGR